MNKTFKYIVLLVLACFVGKANAQELKTEVFSLLNLDYPGLPGGLLQFIQQGDL